MKLSELKNIIRTSIMEKKLCPKGRAYYNRRIAAGESPSAYLSGRAVKVCKGLMNEYEDLSITNSYVDEDGDLDFEQLQADLIKLIPYFRSKLPNYLDNEPLTNDQINQLIEQFVDNLTDIWGSSWMTSDDQLKLSSIWRKADIDTLSDEFTEFVNELSDSWDEYPLDESLRDWFKKEDWVRIDSSGNITGPCGTMKKGDATTRCLPRAKANSLTKAERAATARKKAAADRKGDRVVPYTDKAKVRLEVTNSNPIKWESYIKSETEEMERTAEDLDLSFDVIYHAFINGKEVTLTDEIWSRLENTDSYDIDSEEEAVELARQYGKDIQSILAAEKTPPALILQYSPNKYYLVGGNTRLMVARAKGINPQIILGTVEYENKFAYQDVNDISESDCGCNGPKLILKEGQNVPTISEGLKYHIAEGLQLIHNIYRPLSKEYFNLFNEARKLYNEGLLSVTEDDIEILESNIGETFKYKGIEFPLDYILTEEELMSEVDKKKNPPIGKPKRGGSKKFYVYVRKPGGKIKKVSFGDTTGLRAKLNNPAARRAFAARHDCKNKKDRTKASYWSCRLPRYAKLLGFKTTFSGYW